MMSVELYDTTRDVNSPAAPQDEININQVLVQQCHAKQQDVVAFPTTHKEQQGRGCSLSKSISRSSSQSSLPNMCPG